MAFTVDDMLDNLPVLVEFRKHKKTKLTRNRTTEIITQLIIKEVGLLNKEVFTLADVAKTLRCASVLIDTEQFEEVKPKVISELLLFCPLVERVGKKNNHIFYRRVKQC